MRITVALSDSNPSAPGSDDLTMLEGGKGEREKGIREREAMNWAGRLEAGGWRQEAGGWTALN